MSRILVTGAGGQVGFELLRTLSALGVVVSPDRRALDLARPDSIRAVVRALKPSLIVNAAAYTAVDRAEEETDLSTRVNGIAPGVLAEEARSCGAAIIHYSTDYVFDGSKTTPYVEEDSPAPLNQYGRSKWEGEQAVRAAGGAWLVLRTSWVYGLRGSNFLRTMLRVGEGREELRVVGDQVGAPTWSRMIAEATALIAMQCRDPDGRFQNLSTHAGIYHLAAGGETSWAGFAEAIFGESGLNPRPRVAPITTAEWPAPAKRPANSRLECRRLAYTFGLRLPDWRSGLELCLGERAAGSPGVT